MAKYKKFIYLTFIGTFSILFLNYCSSRELKLNVILITLDTQRADYISAYTLDNALTPNIDFLARNGILFENCYSLIPITLPSHASLFYSKPPYKLNIYNNGEIFNGEGKKSLVEIFKEKGYLSSAFISLGVLSKRCGLTNGFDNYHDEFPSSRWYLNADEINSKVFPWLEKNKDRKFFLWIHYSDPHDPYAPPYLPPDLKIYLNNKLVGEFCLKKYQVEKLKLHLRKGENILEFRVINEFINKPNAFLARFDIFEFSSGITDKLKIDYSRGWRIRKKKDKRILTFKNNSILKIYSSKSYEVELTFRGKTNLSSYGSRLMYKKEVEYMDKEIGKLINKLKQLNLFNKVSIILVGDHGEGLGEYKSAWGGLHFGHIHFLYNVYLKVPLVIYNPYSEKKNIKISEPVTLLDVAPTILKLMRWKKPKEMEGRDILNSTELKKNLEIYSETYAPESYYNRFSIISYPWYLIFTPKKKEFELFKFIKNTLDTKDLYSQYKNRKEVKNLEKKLIEFSKKALKNRVVKPYDKETLRMLKSLGYLK